MTTRDFFDYLHHHPSTSQLAQALASVYVYRVATSERARVARSG